MNDFTWDETLRIGDPEIDADHQGLFALVDELEHGRKGETDLANIIARLEVYAEEHFAREEELMKKIGFPGMEAHIAEHRKFEEWLDTVKATYRRAAESPFLLADTVNQFLEQWLVNHIMKEDMKYKDFMEWR
jgi:hemerythrin